MLATVAQRAEEAVSGARLRILVIGGGIAGATFATLMQQRAHPVAVVERAAKSDRGGYMFGLLPLGGRIVQRLA